MAKDEPKSTTKEERSFIDNLIGTHHHVTKISDGKDKVEGRGSTPEQAEKVASDKWDKKK